MSGTTAAELTDFVYREARLLDELRYEEWLALFASDGIYWMPAEWNQTDMRTKPSLMYEDKMMLRIRIDRLTSARNYAQKPVSRAQHLIQVPQVDEIDDGAATYRTWTPFHYAEVRADEQTIFAGWARHELSREDGALKIKLKRVDLLNVDHPLRSIQLFM